MDAQHENTLNEAASLLNNKCKDISFCIHKVAYLHKDRLKSKQFHKVAVSK